MNILSSGLLNLILLGSQIQQPDTDFIKLERRGGYGPPFGYSVTVYSTGIVEFVGDSRTQFAGKQSYAISKDSVAYLFHKAEAIGIFSLKAEYIVGMKLQKNTRDSFDTLIVTISDIPNQTVSVKIGNRIKSVVDYFKCSKSDKELRVFEAPEDLRVFENEIDRITHTIDFIK